MSETRGSRTLVTAIQFVTLLFASFGGFLTRFAPPEETPGFAGGIASVLLLLVLLFVKFLTKHRTPRDHRRMWFLMSVAGVVISIVLAFTYLSMWDRYTFPYPSDQPTHRFVVGTTLTDSGRKMLPLYGNSPSRLVEDYGVDKRDLFWESDSIGDAQRRLAAVYIFFVIAVGATLFILIEGAAVPRKAIDITRHSPGESGSRSAAAATRAARLEPPSAQPAVALSQPPARSGISNSIRAPAPRDGQRLKLLFLAANPNGTTPLALDDESREIDQKIRASEYRDALEQVTKWAVRPDDLLQYLNEFQPHIVHFSGHGSATEEIMLQDDSRQAKPVSKQALRALFTTLKDNVRVVVLNACYSRPQAEAITEVIDCAIGMNRAIGDRAAITFAASFYRAIGFGRSVQGAFDQGRTALLLAGIPEENTPELLMRSGVAASSIYLIEPQANT